ncbi:hypothetical protein [Pseudoduganella namucuonensis]|uniref:Uncharacterized protein n=1 Tax=Pseudoduganella namucuonensis TaxID=1035707 RepID=A0A1I7KS60_9BURK|nr:hypothetical protein [Pseudoduganella namucuonensis]SFV00312.1 hypothetical protein SAMN05216552_101934 [Pseudoduganella namucuonensis]
MGNSNLFAAFFFPSTAVVLVFFMKYAASVLQARGRLAQDEAYRELAAKAAASQAETAAALADIQARLGRLEKVLKEVE